MRFLITGITGMTGSHLADLLVSKNHDVFGTVREASSLGNIEQLLSRVRLLQTDLLNGQSVSQSIRDARPDVICHLAAQTHVPESWSVSSETLNINIAPELNILEAVRAHQLDTVVHVASSSEVYGCIREDENPINESRVARPANPYAVSKLTQELIARQYFTSHGIKTIVTRTFNHTGPRRRDQFVESNLAKQFVEIELGLKTPLIQVGNLNASRDFTDVRDIVRAYYGLVRSEAFGDTFNVCSGRSIKISEILTILSELTRIQPQVVQESSRLRVSDNPVIRGSYEKLHQVTGWRPTITFKETLDDLLTYWRAALTRPAALQSYTL